MSRLDRKSGLLIAALASAVAAGSVHPVAAAPVLTNTAAVKAALPSTLVDARNGHGGAFVGGLVLGGFLGAAMARPYYYPYYGYYGHPYGYYYGYRSYYYGWGHPAYAYYPRHYWYRHHHHYRHR